LNNNKTPDGVFLFLLLTAAKFTYYSVLIFMTKIATSLRDRLYSIVSTMGYELIGGELSGAGKRSVLRVYIDSENGINIDDCTKVSRQISAMLDVEELIQGHYSLEVSSPGIDRPLFELDQYQKHIGEKLKIKVNSKIEGKKKFVGTLMKVDGNDIHLLVDAEKFILSFLNIDRANVVADIR